MGKDASHLDSTKAEIRSTTRENTTTRRSHSAKLAMKCSQKQNHCTTISALNNQLLVRGSPPAVVVATTNGKPQTTASVDPNKQPTESQCPPGSTLSTCRKSSLPAASPFPNGPMPSVLSARVSATEEKQSTSPDATTGN